MTSQYEDEEEEVKVSMFIFRKLNVPLLIFNVVLLSVNIWLLNQPTGGSLQHDDAGALVYGLQRNVHAAEQNNIDGGKSPEIPGVSYKLVPDNNWAPIVLGASTSAPPRQTTALPSPSQGKLNTKGPRKHRKPKYRPTYVVPNIKTNNLVNCAAILSNDTKEIHKAHILLTKKPKVPIYEETYLEWFKDCSKFKKSRGYVTVPLSEKEQNFPLAFSISMFRDVEQTERLLRAVYQPQNIYCIHIDIKSSLLIHRTIDGLVSCFDNVFVASHLDKVKWGDVSVLLPALNCMKDLVKYHKNKWKYFINLTGQEFPLRTNYELVRIAQTFNGSNDIAGSKERMDMARVQHIWTHRWSKTYQQTIFYDTLKPKPPPPHNLTFFKGEIHGLFSPRMVQYIVESKVAKDYLEWCWDSGHPSEHYWNTLNYNTHLNAPGSYVGPLDIAHAYSFEPNVRAKHWQDWNYGTRECLGKLVRGICVYGVGDLPWLAARKEMFANKFYLTYHYLALDCLEERHRNRTRLRGDIDFDQEYYKRLPTVVYGRKDGMLS